MLISSVQGMQQENVTARNQNAFFDVNPRFKKMSQQDVTSVLQSFEFQNSTLTAEGSKSQKWLIPKMSGNNCNCNFPEVTSLIALHH